MQSCARQLDGELGRIKAAREKGMVPPTFLIDKALAQLRPSAKSAREGGSYVESIERRTLRLRSGQATPGDWAARARARSAVYDMVSNGVPVAVDVETD